MQASEVHAPRDPREKGAFLVLLQNAQLLAAPQADGRRTDSIDLNMGRLRTKVQIMNELSDEMLLASLDTAEGFHRTVAAVGISVTGARQSVRAEWFIFGKKSRYAAGPRLAADCPPDGREMLLWLDDAAWSGDDDTSGELRFTFSPGDEGAQATVLLYTRPGIEYPQRAPEPPVRFDSADYHDMIARSLLSMGNPARLQRALAAARQREITLAFIGGSITQGAGAKPVETQCYACRARQSLSALLGAPVKLVKAGIGGTSSELGMVRFAHDVLRSGVPDLVVIEFAVNDSDDETQGRCFETLVRQALALPGEPAVVLLFSVFADDWNLQERLAPIGRYYGLPMVSVRDAVVPQFPLKAGAGRVLSKRQYFYDSFHPTNDGHRIMADCLTELFRAALAAPACAPQPAPPTALLGRTFDAVRLLDRAHGLPDAVAEAGGFAAQDRNLQCAEPDDRREAVPQFTDNWMHAAGADAAPFRLRVRCRSLFLLEKDSSEDDFGAAEVFADGRLCRTVDPHTVGWIHCGALLLLESDTAAVHEIVIRMRPGEEKQAFTILGFGVC